MKEGYLSLFNTIAGRNLSPVLLWLLIFPTFSWAFLIVLVQLANQIRDMTGPFRGGTEGRRTSWQWSINWVHLLHVSFNGNDICRYTY